MCYRVCILTLSTSRIKDMASRKPCSAPKTDSESSSNSNPQWITESSNPKFKGKTIRFPMAFVGLHSSTGMQGHLKFHVNSAMTGRFAIPGVNRFQGLDMSLISRSKELASTDARRLGLPYLCIAPHHNEDDFIPRPLIAENIGNKFIRWGTSLNPRGEISYLNGFWEWSRRVARLLKDRGLEDLSLAVQAATMEYHRPPSAYRALCEVWCPETSTFVTRHGEIGISLWEMRDISGLSILGDYYEEVIPSFRELTDGKSLPDSCLHLFKAFQHIAGEKVIDRIKHADWLNFWLNGVSRKPNPRGDSKYKKLSNLGKYEFLKSGTTTKVWRPIVIPNQSVSSEDIRDLKCLQALDLELSTTKIDELEIAAYLSIWLCRFVLPSGDDHLRPATFKVASRMAAGVRYSLVPPILASIYKGLTQTFSSERKDLGRITQSFPGHFLYGWVALHFPRGIFDIIDTSFGRPTLRRYSGILNVYQFWEPNMIDCRKLLRGNMDSKNFKWVVSHPPKQVGDQTDVGDLSEEIQEFMMSIRPGYLPCRRGSSYTLEAYSPHRFSRQHGFKQINPGSPNIHSFELNPSTLYSCWLSLTRVGSKAKFHIPGPCTNMCDQIDRKYENWWDTTVAPILLNVSTTVLESSERADFKLVENIASTLSRRKRKAGEDDSIPLPPKEKPLIVDLDVPEERALKKSKAGPSKAKTKKTSVDEIVPKVKSAIVAVAPEGAHTDFESNFDSDDIPLVRRSTRLRSGKQIDLKTNTKDIPAEAKSDMNLSPCSWNKGIPLFFSVLLSIICPFIDNKLFFFFFFFLGSFR
ncbi:uncharacterized protein LOC119998390 [Tripterygium wilfordii]|uniref:uncharacterized protein LOC119998390 n=1 Tax=Tripterygium wilfordii TaxID=458696 RepID=UPI0018F7F7C7|nr:uncharacterized protein LOC119998390 [Tripterygium wilfordii]